MEPKINLLSSSIDDNIVFTTLVRAGLSPQEADVWIERELEGEKNWEVADQLQISEPAVSDAYRRAKTKTNILRITRESMLALEEEQAPLDKIKSKGSRRS